MLGQKDSARVGLAGAGHVELGSLVQRRLCGSWVKPVRACRLVGNAGLASA